jgi:tripartite-type tricarboxylate transporter receptor subunit TctC
MRDERRDFLSAGISSLITYHRFNIIPQFSHRNSMQKKPSFRTLSQIAMATLALCAASASAQPYPRKPVTVITNNAGGGTDLAVRQIAPGLSADLGQPMVVVNTGGQIGPIDGAKAAPDGHTLIVMGSALWTQPLIQDLPWDVARDFAPISTVSLQPHVLFVHPSIPARSVKELIALAKARPGALNNATGSVGTPGHLAGELFKSMAGVDFVQVGYKGSAQGNLAVMAGETHMTFASLGGALPVMQSGKVRVLGVSTAAPTPLLPGVPTIAETVPGFEILVTNSAWAPTGTPDAIIRRLATAFQRVLAQADIKKAFAATGNDVGGSSPEQLMTMMKAEIVRLNKVAGPIRKRLAAETR